MSIFFFGRGRFWGSFLGSFFWGGRVHFPFGPFGSRAQRSNLPSVGGGHVLQVQRRGGGGEQQDAGHGPVDAGDVGSQKARLPWCTDGCLIILSMVSLVLSLLLCFLVCLFVCLFVSLFL